MQYKVEAMNRRLVSILPLSRSNLRAEATVLLLKERLSSPDSRIVILDKTGSLWCRRYFTDAEINSGQVQIIDCEPGTDLMELFYVDIQKDEWVQILSDDDFWFGIPSLDFPDERNFLYADVVGHYSSGPKFFSEDLPFSSVTGKRISEFYLGDGGWHGLISPRIWEISREWILKTPYKFPHLSLQVSWLAALCFTNSKISNFLFVKDCVNWEKSRYKESMQNFYSRIGLDPNFAVYEPVIGTIDRVLLITSESDLIIHSSFYQYFNQEINEMYSYFIVGRRSLVYWNNLAKRQFYCLIYSKYIYRFSTVIAGKNTSLLGLKLLSKVEKLIDQLCAQADLPRDLREFWNDEVHSSRRMLGSQLGESVVSQDSKASKKRANLESGN